MIYSQCVYKTPRDYLHFVKYKDKEVDGESLHSNEWFSFLDRTKHKYSKFHLELIYD